MSGIQLGLYTPWRLIGSTSHMAGVREVPDLDESSLAEHRPVYDFRTATCRPAIVRPAGHVFGLSIPDNAQPTLYGTDFHVAVFKTRVDESALIEADEFNRTHPNQLTMCILCGEETGHMHMPPEKMCALASALVRPFDFCVIDAATTRDWLTIACDDYFWKTDGGIPPGKLLAAPPRAFFARNDDDIGLSSVGGEGDGHVCDGLVFAGLGMDHRRRVQPDDSAEHAYGAANPPNSITAILNARVAREGLAGYATPSGAWTRTCLAAHFACHQWVDTSDLARRMGELRAAADERRVHSKVRLGMGIVRGAAQTPCKSKRKRGRAGSTQLGRCMVKGACKRGRRDERKRRGGIQPMVRGRILPSSRPLEVKDWLARADRRLLDSWHRYRLDTARIPRSAVWECDGDAVGDGVCDVPNDGREDLDDDESVSGWNERQGPTDSPLLAPEMVGMDLLRRLKWGSQWRRKIELMRQNPRRAKRGRNATRRSAVETPRRES